MLQENLKAAYLAPKEGVHDALHWIVCLRMRHACRDCCKGQGLDLLLSVHHVADS